MFRQLVPSKKVKGGLERDESVGEGFDAVPLRLVSDLVHHSFDCLFDIPLRLNPDSAEDFVRVP